jgi:hypothetical protein
LSKANKFEKENEVIEEVAAFRALPLDRKILQEQTFRPEIQNRVIEASPFRLATAERAQNAKASDKEEEFSGFKAKEMPKYKFFEPTSSVKKQM